MYQNLCVCVYVLLLWLPFNVDAEYFVLVMKGGGGGTSQILPLVYGNVLFLKKIVLWNVT